MNGFNFRVAPRVSGSLGPNSGNTTTLIINSFKIKYINGNADGKINVAFDDPLSSQVPSWLQISHVWSDAEEAYKVTFKALENNTGAARSFTATFTQRESGKQISYTITQGDFTYTYFLGVLDVSSTIEANIGATTSIRVQSYMTRSDGEVMAKQPSVGATPSWATKVTVKKEDESTAGEPHWYRIIVEATAANLGSAERSGTLLVTCGDQRKEVTIRQKAEEPDITLTIHWPLNQYSAAFFKTGQIPQSGTTGIAYFNFVILDNTSVHKYKKSTGIRVNLRDGSTEIAYPGDSITAYTFTNQDWQLISTFTLPSSDKTITI